MTYYHPSKAAALESARDLEALGFSARIGLAPYNGWVIILTPLTKAVFDQPLGPLLDRAEIDLSSYALLARRPADYKRPPQVEQQKSRAPAEGGKPSPSGATGKVWLIADRVYGQSGLDRKAIIDACIAEGINPATAGTQYSKWKKAKGL